MDRADTLILLRRLVFMLSLLFVAGAHANYPNILVVLIDDAAFMDLQPYGGEAATPNIQELADRGAMFTQFRASPLCSPSRAMLLTGMDNHQVGLGIIEEVIPPQFEGKAGYTLQLEPGVKTIATRLREVGYRTYLTGKWHLGNNGKSLPVDQGFDRSFVLDASGADNWEDKTFMPLYEEADWFEGRQPARLPDDFYSSEFLVDQMLAYIEQDRAQNAPFFAYIGFQAIHIPIQAPREDTQRYVDTYRDGWEALRLARWKKAQSLGFVSSDAPMTGFPDFVRSWDSLTDEQRAMSSKSMAVNAGMLEAMDRHLGRLIDYLEREGELDNTIILVTSDNGPEYSDPMASTGFGLYLKSQDYNRDLETLGEKGSFAFIGTEWALAAAAPFNRFKFHTSEGGVRVPFILAGPRISGKVRTNTSGFMQDVTPTLLDLSGIAYDEEEFFGRSLKPAIDGLREHVYGPDDAVGMEVAGNSALFLDNWKLVRNHKPWGTGDWQLYNLSNDPGETKDLYLQEPELASRMLSRYMNYADEVGVLEVPPGYHPSEQLAINSRRVLLHRYWHVIALLIAGSLAVIVLFAASWVTVKSKRDF